MWHWRTVRVWESVGAAPDQHSLSCGALLLLRGDEGLRGKEETQASWPECIVSVALVWNLEL